MKRLAQEEQLRLIEKLNKLDVDSDKYLAILERLERLSDIKLNEEPEKEPWFAQISADVAVSVLGNLLAVILVLNFEKVNVVSSKATSFWKRST